MSGHGDAGHQPPDSKGSQLPSRTPIVVTLRGEEGAEVQIELFGRAHPEQQDYWDGNWLRTRVKVRAGGFRGEFESELRAEEFLRLRDGVRVCMTDLRGTFVFETLEDQLEIIAKGDGLGHFRAKCRAEDVAGIGNELTFTIDLDQTYLPPLASQLDAALRAFPVLGHPAA